MSSSDGEDNDYNSNDEQEEFRNTLRSHIYSIKSSGLFATSGAVPICLPGITVNSENAATAEIGLPLSIEQAQALIKISSQAPFGKGARTVNDTSIRNTWEIDLSRIVFSNPEWPSCLRQIVETAAAGLGVDCDLQHVRAEPHKMLIYEKGAMFKSYQDTEKVPGMFGTLVLCLPSLHKGGAVSLRHDQKNICLETEPNSHFRCTYMAWYGDIFHEVGPVTDGYRWVLTYNLVRDPGTGAQSAASSTRRESELGQILHRWHHYHRMERYLIFPLSYQYSHESLRLQDLKSIDSARFRHVNRACQQDRNFYAFLANMEKHEYSHVDECDEEAKVSTWLTIIRDTDNVQLLVKETRVDEDQIVTTNQHDREPDEQSGGEYQGNQHAEIDRIYRDSVMIIAHSDHLSSLLNGENDSPRDLDRLLDRLLEHTSHDLFLSVCRSILKRSCADVLAGSVAVAACHLKDVDLFKKAVEHATAGFDQESWTRLGSLIDLTELVVPEESIVKLLTSSTQLHVTYNGIAAFRLGLEKRPANVYEIAHREGWLAYVLTKWMEQTTSTHENDAYSLVTVILEQTGSFRQFILFQSVMKFLTKRMNGTLPSALLLEIALRLPQNDFARTLLLHLTRTIAEHNFPGLTIDRCVTYLVYRGHYGSPLKFAEAIWSLYTLLDSYHRPALLRQLHSQDPRVMDNQVCTFIISLLEQLVPISVPSETDQSIFQSFVTMYIASVVGVEPIKPKDWARPQDACDLSHVYNPCQCIHRINDFLKDAEQEKYEGSCEHGKRPESYFMKRYLEVVSHPKSREKDQPSSFSISKTCKRWEELHANWDEKSKQVLQCLGKISNLRQCLGQEYDSIISLSAFRVSEEKAEPLTPGVQAGKADPAASAVPCKRTWSDS